MHNALTVNSKAVARQTNAAARPALRVSSSHMLAPRVNLNTIRCNATAEVCTLHSDRVRGGAGANPPTTHTVPSIAALRTSLPPYLAPSHLSSPLVTSRHLSRQPRTSTNRKQAPAPVTNAAEPSYEAPAATYAVVDIGGHQLIVEEGRWYTVNRLDVPEGSVIELGRVLALKQNGQFKVGQPYLDGVKVEAEILGEEKGDKVIVYKMKPKKHYRRTNGHRQPLTKFLVTKISA